MNCFKGVETLAHVRLIEGKVSEDPLRLGSHRTLVVSEALDGELTSRASLLPRVITLSLSLSLTKVSSMINVLLIFGHQAVLPSKANL